MRFVPSKNNFPRRHSVSSAYTSAHSFIKYSLYYLVSSVRSLTGKEARADNVLNSSQQGLGNPTFPSENSKLAEMDNYLVNDLEYDLIVFHPYHTLLASCRKDSEADAEAEAGDLGTRIGAEDGPRYWGSGRDPHRNRIVRLYGYGIRVAVPVPYRDLEDNLRLRVRHYSIPYTYRTNTAVYGSCTARKYPNQTTFSQFFRM